LYQAGYQFANARQDSFWVVIALFGGPANASDTIGYPDGRCPGSNGNPTWKLPGGSGYCRDEDTMPASFTPPFVADWNNDTQRNAFVTYSDTYWNNFDWSTYTLPSTRSASHSFTVDTTTDPHTYDYGADYDADDYARDGADFVTAPPPKGQSATLFSICMGDYCRFYPNNYDPAAAEFLGQYMARYAGGAGANHGLYFYAEDASVVDDAFGAIADNIFTRISQ
jgi:hypothetical protein